jgi:hypothetical protein
MLVAFSLMLTTLNNVFAPASYKSRKSATAL